MPVGRAETETSTVGVTGVAGAVSTVFYRIFFRFLFWGEGAMRTDLTDITASKTLTFAL